MSCGPFAVLWGRRCVLTERILRITHALGASPEGCRCVVGRALSSQGEYFSKKAILGASPHCGRCVVGWTLCSQGSCFLINTPWGISSGRTLWCQSYVVFSREVLFIRHSFGHLLMVDAVLWDGRCVLKGSIFSNRHSLGHLLMADAVLWDVRCVLKGSIF